MKDEECEEKGVRRKWTGAEVEMGAKGVIRLVVHSSRGSVVASPARSTTRYAQRYPIASSLLTRLAMGGGLASPRVSGVIKVNLG